MAKQQLKKTVAPNVRALVIKGFRCIKSGNEYRKRDIIEVSQSRFDQLNGTFLKKAPKNADVTKVKSGGCGC